MAAAASILLSSQAAKLITPQETAVLEEGRRGQRGATDSCKRKHTPRQPVLTPWAVKGSWGTVLRGCRVLGGHGGCWRREIPGRGDVTHIDTMFTINKSAWGGQEVCTTLKMRYKRSAGALWDGGERWRVGFLTHYAVRSSWVKEVTNEIKLLHTFLSGLINITKKIHELYLYKDTIETAAVSVIHPQIPFGLLKMNVYETEMIGKVEKNL